MERPGDVVGVTEYIKNVLYLATARPGTFIEDTIEAHYFTIDEELIYENYYSDFGPLNLSCVYKYCKKLNDKFKTYLNRRKIVHYTSTDPRMKANSAFLLGCYGVLYLDLSAKEALKPLTSNGQVYKPFQDAVQGDSEFTITLLDCLNGIKKAQEFGFFNFQDFDCEEYDILDKIQGGDLNWIVPGKFLALIGPVVALSTRMSLYHPPASYVRYFRENNVNIVIRLNKKFYDAQEFTNEGIQHFDLYFPDGSVPPKHILVKFLQISEDYTDTAIAVHCKAGLGRTGSLIGCYLIKHYGMSALEAIGWMRICRPGSVISHQQRWLMKLEPWLLKQGNKYRRIMYDDCLKFPRHDFGIYSYLEKAVRLQKHSPNGSSGSALTSRSASPTNTRSIAPAIPQPIPPKLQPSNISASKKKVSSTATSSAGTHGSNVKLSREWLMNARRNISPSMHLNEHYTQGITEIDTMINKRSTGAGGEPRPVQATQRSSLFRRTESPERLNVGRANDANSRHRNRVYTVAPLRNVQASNAKNIDDAKNTLTRSTTQYQTKVSEQNRMKKSLESAITITQGATAAAVISDENNMPIYVNNAVHYPNSGSRSPAVNRSRLGRSPSPPKSRQVSQRSRTTSTHNLVFPPKPPIGTQKLSALHEELSKLQTGISLAREHSSDAASLGVGSLGARRDAPRPPPAPTVRSDNRQLATQGDLLNSVKYERRLRAKMLERKCASGQHAARGGGGACGVCGGDESSTLFFPMSARRDLLSGADRALRMSAQHVRKANVKALKEVAAPPPAPAPACRRHCTRHAL